MYVSVLSVLSDVSQTERDRYHKRLSCVGSLVSLKGYLESSAWLVEV